MPLIDFMANEYNRRIRGKGGADWRFVDRAVIDDDHPHIDALAEEDASRDALR